MVSIDDRIQFTGKNLDKIQKQVEECNPIPLEQDLVGYQNRIYYTTTEQQVFNWMD